MRKARVLILGICFSILTPRIWSQAVPAIYFKPDFLPIVLSVDIHGVIHVNFTKSIHLPSPINGVIGIDAPAYQFASPSESNSAVLVVIVDGHEIDHPLPPAKHYSVRLQPGLVLIGEIRVDENKVILNLSTHDPAKESLVRYNRHLKDESSRLRSANQREGREIETLQTEKRVLTQKTNLLRTQREEGYSATRDLKRQAIDRQTRIIQLNADLDDLKSRLDSVSAELQSARSDNAELQKQIADFKSQIATKNSEIAALKDELAKDKLARDNAVDNDRHVLARPSSSSAYNERSTGSFAESSHAFYNSTTPTTIRRHSSDRGSARVIVISDDRPVLYNGYIISKVEASTRRYVVRDVRTIHLAPAIPPPGIIRYESANRRRTIYPASESVDFSYSGEFDRNRH